MTALAAYADHSQQHPENPSGGGVYGDGGNRTHARFPAVVDHNCVLIMPSQRTHDRVRLPVVRLPFEWHEDRRVPCQDVRDLGVDRCGRRRSRATDPNFRKGQKPPNAGRKYYPTPYTDEQVLAFMAACPDTRPYRRLRALVCVLWRSGLRISEALDLYPEDLDEQAGTVLVRKGKGGKRGISAMDQFGFDALNEWMVERVELPPGPVFCVANGRTAGERWSPAGVRQAMARVKARGGFTERWAPHQLRHTMAVGLAKEGVLLPLISKQLRHNNIATTSTYLSGISPQDVIDAISARPAPSAATVVEPKDLLVLDALANSLSGQSRLAPTPPSHEKR